MSNAQHLTNYDAIAFLLYFNEGYPMSIPDMVGAFHVIDPKNPNDGLQQLIAATSPNTRPFTEDMLETIRLSATTQYTP